MEVGAEQEAMEDGNAGSSRFPGIASTEEIQRRLVRPSQGLGSSSEGCSSSLDPPDHYPKLPGEVAKRGPEEERREKRLEDYLDPALLAAISSKLRGQMRAKEKRRRLGSFRRVPGDDGLGRRKARRTEAGGMFVAVDGEDDCAASASPFGSFEETAARLSHL